MSPYTHFYTDDLSLDCVVEGKPEFSSIYWDIPDTADDIYKSTDQGSESNGKLTKHTVRLEWNTADIQRRKAGNQVPIKCHADNVVDDGPQEQSVTLNIQCMCSLTFYKMWY